MFAAILDGWKNRGLTPDQVPAGEAASFANGKGKKLYVAYQERLKTLNAADFGDLLLECIRLFRQNPDVLRQYQARFKYILVDEYQDTNVAQYLWLKLLAQPVAARGLTRRIAAAAARQPSPPGERDDESENADSQPESRRPASSKERAASRRRDPRRGPLAPLSEGMTRRVSARRVEPASATGAPLAPTLSHRGENVQGRKRHPKNICCVGDDDQSIYGWRGAEVDNILRFDHDFPGAKVIRLERNYRSTGHILAAASHLIAHNEGRLGKTLRTEDVPGEKVTVTGAWDSRGRSARHRRARSKPCSARRASRASTIRSTRSPSWCAPRSRCANSRTASSSSACPTASSAGPASTSAWRSATRSPICA